MLESFGSLGHAAVCTFPVGLTMSPACWLSLSSGVQHDSEAAHSLPVNLTAMCQESQSPDECPAVKACQLDRNVSAASQLIWTPRNEILVRLVAMLGSSD